MFLLILGICISTGGFTLLAMTYMFPILRMVYFDWIGGFVLLLPWIITMYRLKTTATWELADKIPRNKSLMIYLRRDGHAIPVIGSRVYSGESFLEVPGIGLVEDLGKGCVFNFGDKKIRFLMENLNYTSEMKFANYTAELSKLGFGDTNDLYNALNGGNLELMGKSYLKMIDEKETAFEKFVDKEKEKEPEVIVPFVPVEEEKKETLEDIRRNVDKRLDRTGGVSWWK